MATLKWAILCERSILEERSQTLSMIAMIERVTVNAPTPKPLKSGQKGPLIPYRISIVQYWRRSNPTKPENVWARLKLVDPSGRTFGVIEQAIDLTSHHAVRALAAAPGFPAVGPGTVQVVFHTSKDKKVWKLAGKEQFEVVFTSPNVPSLAEKATKKKTH